ncbi:hypothetical protein [Bacterioplanoides sp. SCSIO 12839]|uniref:hypothetical protein n=1 Tax=Bacterioplanoides sp. SCSIO 12839 TaxID=2829569 RepID=UPI002105AD95|nr:hypothetical protein [Bacterioplanoides sp. SCSIO 12839]UTW48977.1 hypothetical protein KFF03_03465 [Bacterioplanoides sp. SCSIO 12839]
MLIENSSDLIQSVQPGSLSSGKRVDLAVLVNGQVLVISDDALALFVRPEDVGNELGNGLIRSVALPEAFCLPLENDRYLQEHRAGYVGLSDGRVLLITLNDVQMFPSKQDALRNQNEVTRMKLG